MLKYLMEQYLLQNPVPKDIGIFTSSRDKTLRSLSGDTIGEMMRFTSLSHIVEWFSVNSEKRFPYPPFVTVCFSFPRTIIRLNTAAVDFTWDILPKFLLFSVRCVLANRPTEFNTGIIYMNWVVSSAIVWFIQFTFVVYVLTYRP